MAISGDKDVKEGEEECVCALHLFLWEKLCEATAADDEREKTHHKRNKRKKKKL